MALNKSGAEREGSQMKSMFITLFLFAGVVRADLLVNFPTNAAWVTVNQNGQGVSGGAVAWSLSSARSPLANYSGPVYYGGATGSLALTVNGMGVANATPDYLNTVSASGVAGDWVATAPMFALAQSSTLTNLTLTARATGGGAVQTNYLRLVIQQDGQLYISGTNWFNIGTSANQSFNSASLSALTWYSYDPVANLRGNEGALVAGVGATNVTAVGVLLYNQNLAARSATVGLSSFMAYGDIWVVPEPHSVVLLGLGACALRWWSTRRCRRQD
jgi:hypothetical protein